MTILEQNIRTERSTILGVEGLEVVNHFLHASDVRQNFRFCELCVRIVVSQMALILHRYEGICEVLNGSWEFRDNLAVLASVARIAMF